MFTFLVVGVSPARVELALLSKQRFELCASTDSSHKDISYCVQIGRVELPRPFEHNDLNVACLPFPTYLRSPSGIRTRSIPRSKREWSSVAYRAKSYHPKVEVLEGDENTPLYESLSLDY